MVKTGRRVRLAMRNRRLQLQANEDNTKPICAIHLRPRALGDSHRLSMGSIGLRIHLKPSAPTELPRDSDLVVVRSGL
jgi:hypothetical protein